jgi:hypothetical protein
MASTIKTALLFFALTLLFIVAIIGINLILSAQTINGTHQTPVNDASLSNGTSLTAMDDLFPLPEFGAIGGLGAIIACFAAIFVVYQRKKK